jgi:hypothetical protein
MKNCLESFVQEVLGRPGIAGRPSPGAPVAAYFAVLALILR